MRKFLLLAALAVCVGPVPAWADSIDGDWCRADRHFTIRGATIRTPGGAAVTGEYHRHDFAYVVPTGEPGQGSLVAMVLRDERTVNLWQRPPGATAAAGEPEVWKRCEMPVS